MTTLPTRFRQLLPGAGDRCQGPRLESRGQVTLPTRRLRHLAAAGLIAAAAMVSGSAIGQPATACAEPREWDIQAYDQCVWKHLGEITNDVEELTVKHDCCLQSGGDWNAPEGKCVAPPANSAQAPANVPTHTLQPVPPPVRQPGAVNPTLTLAPAS